MSNMKKKQWTIILLHLLILVNIYIYIIFLGFKNGIN